MKCSVSNDPIAGSGREGCQARALLEMHILGDSVSASRQSRQPPRPASLGTGKTHSRPPTGLTRQAIGVAARAWLTWPVCGACAASLTGWWMDTGGEPGQDAQEIS